jgi:hypothetical protein
MFCHLFAAADALDQDRVTALSVLAAVADPRARRGVRHRLAVILALSVCAVLAGARSFTAIAEWAADADEAPRTSLGITGGVPCESTIRRTLQRLDADAFDDAAGAWAQQRTEPLAGQRWVVAWTARRYAGQPAARIQAGTCWPPWITATAWSWARSMSRRRRTSVYGLAATPER